MRICDLCGKTFQARAPNHKYCSVACRQAASALRRVPLDHVINLYHQEDMLWDNRCLDCGGPLPEGAILPYCGCRVGRAE